jgi:putative ABC transport system ATP-binding protein
MNDRTETTNPKLPFLKSKARLEWTQDGHQNEWLIEKSETTVGRAPENNIFIDDQEASRFHSVIVIRDDDYLLLDLDSSNGTYVNGSKIKEHTLQDGDHIQIGKTDFLFRLLTPEPEPAPESQTRGRIYFEENGSKTVLNIGAGLKFGRSTENNVILRDIAASRFHCLIIPEREGYYIVDLNSTNGTYVNDTRISGREPLRNGDRIRVGKLEINFETFIPEVTPVETAAEEAIVEGPFVTEEQAELQEARPKGIVDLPILKAPKPVSIGTEVVIDIKDVIKEYDTPVGTVRILKSVSMQAFAGTFVGVRGPSGSGKSTLLNMITGIDHPTSGDVIILGQSLSKLSENKMARWRGENIGVIFQFFQLLPTLTIVENIMLPMDFCRKWKPKERVDRAMHLLEMVGLAEHANKLPSMLSGGQQQRAAIARAIANDPPLIVADEPTGNLDSKTADVIFTLFSALVEHGTTFLMVTHDVELAQRIPRVIQVLDGELIE